MSSFLRTVREHFLRAAGLPPDARSIEEDELEVESEGETVEERAASFRKRIERRMRRAAGLPTFDE
jgi:hypothetical protein